MAAHGYRGTREVRAQACFRAPPSARGLDRLLAEIAGAGLDPETGALPLLSTSLIPPPGHGSGTSPGISLVIDINRLGLFGVFDGGPRVGYIRWHDGARAWSGSFFLQGAGTALHVFTRSPWSGTARIEAALSIGKTRTFAKGWRRWFVCQGLDGRPCGRRLARMYLPGGTSQFACRHCHGLRYGRGTRDVTPGPLQVANPLSVRSVRSWVAFAREPAEEARAPAMALAGAGPSLNSPLRRPRIALSETAAREPA